MEQQIKIKCPHCGWIRSIDIQAYTDVGETDAARGLGDELKKAAETIRKLLTTSSVDEASTWLDMPKCPECEKTYRYNVKTHTVKP